MTCRDEVLAAATELVRQGIDPFSRGDVIREMRCRGSRYKDSTIATHVGSRMCVNSPDNHARTYDDLVRVCRGLYSLKN